MIHRMFCSIIGFALFLCLGCTSEMREQLAGTSYAFGKAGKVAVLADNSIWDQAPGDTLEFYYASAFPILPQPEPLVDLQHQTFDDLIQDPVRKQLRSFLILVNLSDRESRVTEMAINDMGEETLSNGFKSNDYQLKVGKNKWAENQLLLYIIGKNESGLIDGIKASLPNFTKRLFEFDKLQYEANLFQGGHNEEIEEKLKSYYQINMPIPERFNIGIDKKPFLWVQDITAKFTNGLIFYKEAYQDEKQFSEPNMIMLRDSLTKKNIRGSKEGTFVKINNVDLPTFHYPREIDGKYAAELRGIWTMENDFMGGAFVSFLIHDPTRNQVIFVDVFVHGPGSTKREAMKELIYLVEELKLAISN